MNDTWWVVLGATAAVLSLAIIVHLLRSARPKLLDGDAAQRAYTQLLSDLPLTDPPTSWSGGTGAAQRVLGYVSSSYGVVDGVARPVGGLPGWWPMDAAALQALTAAAATDLSAILAFPSEVRPADVPDVEAAPWATLTAGAPQFAEELRALPALDGFLATSPVLANSISVPETATLPEVLVSRLDRVSVETTVLADQVDAYVSKRAADEPWRLAVSRGLATAKEALQRPAVRPVIELVKRANQRLGELLAEAGWADGVDALRAAGNRMLADSGYVEQMRHWFADPATFDDARAEALAARSDVEQLEAALRTERDAIVEAWQRQLGAARLTFDNRRQEFLAAVVALQEWVAPKLQEQAFMDAQTAVAILDRAGQHVGSRGRRSADWRARAELAIAGSSDEVLQVAIAVPGGTEIVREWLESRVLMRAAMLHEVRAVLEQVRAAAEVAVNTIATGLLHELEQLQSVAEMRLGEHEERIRQRRDALQHHVEALTAWADGSAT